ncbi:hypothetical protein EIP86_002690 [Pleurotus ostreatoroseus]|nr:hypothetical protein EIP86_002690 [Pleurotus ostreatoroseus]
MSENKRKSDGRDRQRRRFRYVRWHENTEHDYQRSQCLGHLCTRKREAGRRGVVAEELWPESDNLGNADPDRKGDDGTDEDDEDDGDIEKQLEKEMTSMKRPRKEQRFVDPIQLVVKHVSNIISSGATQTRYAQRLTPVSTTCPTNLPEMKALCTRLLEPFFEAEDGKTFSYKLELRMRNHNTLSRKQIIDELAACVPSEHKVNLENPDVFILIEIFKSVCGMGVVRDYYRWQKFNVMEIAKTEEPGFKQGEGRVGQKDATTPAKETPTEYVYTHLLMCASNLIMFTDEMVALASYVQ